MFSSYSTRFFAVFALALTLFTACRPGTKTDGGGPPAPAEELKSEIPFAAREPEVFQTELVTTAGATERRVFLARRAASRRVDYDFGRENQLTVLETDKFYLLLPARKIYAEASAAPEAAADEWQEFLTTEWLSAKTEARFDKLETTENVTRYRVATAGRDLSEIFVFVDEKLGLPVRQEFYSVSGAEKTLTFSVELKNLRLQAEDDLFVVPADYKKVPAEQLRKLWRESGN